MINALKSKILGYDEITHKILQTLSLHNSHLLSYIIHTHTHTHRTVFNTKKILQKQYYTSSLHIKFYLESKSSVYVPIFLRLL